MSRSAAAVYFDAARADSNVQPPVFERHSRSDARNDIDRMLSRLEQHSNSQMLAMSIGAVPNADATALLNERMKSMPYLYQDVTPADLQHIDKINKQLAKATSDAAAKSRRKKNGELDPKRVAALETKPAEPDYFWLGDEQATANADVDDDDDESMAEKPLLGGADDDDTEDESVGGSSSGDDGDGTDDDDDDDANDGEAVVKKRRKSAPTPQNAKPLSKGKKMQAERKRLRKEELSSESGKARLLAAASDYIYVAAANVFQRNAAGDAPIDRTFAQAVRDDRSDHEQITRLKRSMALIDLELFGAINACFESAPVETEILRDLVNDASEIRQLPMPATINAAVATCAILRQPTPGHLSAIEIVRSARKPAFVTICSTFERLCEDFRFVVNPMAHAEAIVTARLRHMRGFVNGKTTLADMTKLLVEDQTKSAAAPAFVARYKLALDRVDTFCMLLERARALVPQK